MLSNNAVLIQHVYSNSPYADMMRLSYQRHAAYTRAHEMD